MKSILSYYFSFKYMPIIIYTIVMNGWPFITYHYEEFSKMNRFFQWHIIEGYAEGRDNYKNPGKSIDKTSEYIDFLLFHHPGDIVVHRAPFGKFWRDKIEMISVMNSIKFSCTMMAVFFPRIYCRWMLMNYGLQRKLLLYQKYFLIATVKDKYVTITPNKPSHMNSYEWIRAWKYDYGDTFVSHAPPILKHFNLLLFSNRCYLHSYTEANGLVFTHYSYTEENIVKFKDSFYGSKLFSYKNWSIINNYTGKLPLEVSKYFGWMKPKTYIDIASKDPFGKNVSVVEYPQPFQFKSVKYKKNIKRVISFIRNNVSKLYIMLLKHDEYEKDKLMSKLIEIALLNKEKSINIFIEYVVFRDIFATLPKIWHSGKTFIELYKGNIIYGYMKIIYVDYIFFLNKQYKKFNVTFL